MKQMSKLAAAIALGLAYASAALAADMHMNHTASAHAAEAKAPMSDGEVKKIDKEAGKITIKHGPLENLGMPGMTMIFRVKDPALLDKVKSGDKIKFVADKVNGAFTVTQLEPAK